METKISKEDFHEAQSMIQKLYHEYKKAGIEKPYQTAEEKISETFPMFSFVEFKSQMGHCRHIYGEIKENVKKKKDRYSDLYKEWCSKNDYVTIDSEIAFWVGCTPGALSAARENLKLNGYIFEKNGHGWNIQRPVEEKKYTETDIQNAIREVLKKINK